MFLYSPRLSVLVHLNIVIGVWYEISPQLVDIAHRLSQTISAFTCDDLVDAWCEQEAHAFRHIENLRDVVMIVVRECHFDPYSHMVHSVHLFERVTDRLPVNLLELTAFAHINEAAFLDPSIVADDEPLHSQPTNNLERLLPIPNDLTVPTMCTLCQDEIKGSTMYCLSPCSHCFHSEDCMDGDTVVKWLRTSDKCPTCRTRVVID